MIFNYFEMLSGEPIAVLGIGHFRSPFLRDIYPSSGIGYDAYNLYINFLSWDKDKIIKYDQVMGLHGADRLAKEDKLTAFDVATILEQTREYYREILSFFMLEELEWDDSERKYVAILTDDDGQHIAGEINRDNFEEVRRSILQLNFIGLDKDNKPAKYSDDRSKELWEKVQKYLKDQPQDKEESPEYHLGNIVSKLCTVHPSYNYLNVYKLTIFQVYDAFFQCLHIRSSDLNERIFSTHGGDKFRFEDWLKPILRHV